MHLRLVGKEINVTGYKARSMERGNNKCSE
jgi:hypothetical protein